jgi:ABC-type cobalamin/Fe3+-siderophores transport system ATPase subunit
MNKQFIPFYDEASARWLEMVEQGTIPLTNDLKGASKEYMKAAVDSILKNVKEEDLFDDYFEELAESEFESAVPPKDPKKIH